MFPLLVPIKYTHALLLLFNDTDDNGVDGVCIMLFETIISIDINISP